MFRVRQNFDSKVAGARPKDGGGQGYHAAWESHFCRTRPGRVLGLLGLLILGRRMHAKWRCVLRASPTLGPCNSFLPSPFPRKVTTLKNYDGAASRRERLSLALDEGPWAHVVMCGEWMKGPNEGTIPDASSFSRNIFLVYYKGETERKISLLQKKKFHRLQGSIQMLPLLLETVLMSVLHGCWV